MAQSKTRYGIVVLVDALGVGYQSLEQSVIFFKDRDKILEAANKSHAEAIAKFKQGVEEIWGDKSFRFEHRTFGDTIAFTWSWSHNSRQSNQKSKIDNWSRVYQLLPIVAQYLSVFFCMAFSKQILFRGAISFGEFLVSSDNTALIGPAVADAAKWYEKADWAGLIATPQMGYAFDSTNEYLQTSEGKKLNPVAKLETAFVSYKVPLKSQEQNLWSLAWFNEYKASVLRQYPSRSAEIGKYATVQFLRDMSLCSIAIGTEAKYENTIKFFTDNIGGSTI
jgi:hypothetical protein